jgi:hypothetical protein
VSIRDGKQEKAERLWFRECKRAVQGLARVVIKHCASGRLTIIFIDGRPSWVISVDEIATGLVKLVGEYLHDK